MATILADMSFHDGKYNVTSDKALQAIGRNATTLGRDYRLDLDIDASGTAHWNGGSGFDPIEPYTGTFDGDNRTIAGLAIDRADTGVGLFGETGTTATVRDVTLSDAAVTGDQDVGPLVGSHRGTVTRTAIDGGTVTTTRAAGQEAHLGGLVGALHDGTVSRSFSTATVDANGADEAGGIAGDIAGSASIDRVFFTGAVTNGGDRIGGILGDANDGAELTNAFAAGSVSGGTDVGGLIGRGAGSTVTDAYWDAQATGQDSSASGGTKLQTADMQTLNATVEMHGLDFFDVWMPRAGGYPQFARDSPYADGPAAYDALVAGSGTEANPYNITNVYELQRLDQRLGANATITADLNASGTEQWHGGKGFEPLGDSTTAFTGSLDGQGHNITELVIDRPGESEVGLFGRLGAAGNITTVRLINATVTGDGGTGSLAGRSDGTITKVVATGSVLGGSSTGGLVGSNRGTIVLAYTNVTVDTDTSKTNDVGGLAGYNSNGGQIANSSTTGDVTISGDGWSVGGLVGFNKQGTVTRSFATGAVSGTDSGGVVGRNDDTVSVSYWDTETTGQSGAVGKNNGQVTDVTGLGTADMKGQPAADILAFDFEGTWDVLTRDVISYPFLRAPPERPVPGKETIDRDWRTVNASVSLAVDGTATLAEARIILENPHAGDHLRVNTSVTDAVEYNRALSNTTDEIGDTRAVIELEASGTTATVNEFLQVFRTAEFANTDNETSLEARRVRFSLGPTLPADETGHYYEHVDTARSWTTARDTSHTYPTSGSLSRDGYLATIRSADENEWIDSIAGDNSVWLGAADHDGDQAEGEWEWEANSPEDEVRFFVVGDSPELKVGYENWRSGEPNNADGNQHRLKMYPAGDWDDDNDGDAFQYVVEYGDHAIGSDLNTVERVTIVDPDPPEASFPVAESFESGSPPANWTVGGDAQWGVSHNASATTKTLRLTAASDYEAGFALWDVGINATTSFAVEFEYYAGDGTGADGLAFFLVNGTVTDASNINISSAGGSGLGYAHVEDPSDLDGADTMNGADVDGSTDPVVSMPDEHGVPNGYLGVGFDEYGLYSSTAEGKDGGETHTDSDATDAEAQSVAIRGSGDLGEYQNGYPYLNGTNVSSTYGERLDDGWQNVTVTVTPLDTTGDGQPDASNVVVQLSWDGGDTWRTVLDVNHTAAPPETLKLGLAATTGGSNNNHAIDNLEVTLPTDLNLTVTNASAGGRPGTAIEFNYTVANDGPNANDEITVTDNVTTGTAGLENYNWSYTTDGSSPDGNGTGTTVDLDLNDGETATVTVTADIGSDVSRDLVHRLTADEGSSFIDPTRDDQSATHTVAVNTAAPEPEPAAANLSALDIAGQGTHAALTAGNETDVTVDLENTGGQSGTFAVKLAITNDADSTTRTTTVKLAGGEAVTVTFVNVTGTLSMGTYDVTVTTDGAAIEGELVVEKRTGATIDALRIDASAPPVALVEGTDASVQANLTNTGSANETFDVTLTVENETTSTVTVNRTTTTAPLAPNATTVVHVSNVTGDLPRGNYTVTLETLNTSVSGNLSIEQPAITALTALDIAGQGPNATVTRNESVTVTVHVSNVGDRPGSVTPTVVLGADGSPVRELRADPLTLAAGANATVTFTDVIDGVEAGTYVVNVSTPDDYRTGTLEVVEPASVAVTDLDIAGQGRDATIAPGTTGTITATVRNVGDLDANTSVTLTLANETGVVLANETTHIVSLGPGGDQSVSLDGLLGTLEAGNYTVTAATPDDQATGTLTVQAADDDEEEDDEEAAEHPSIGVSTRSMTFGETPVGTTETLTLTIENLATSDQPLTVNSTHITGVNPESFAVVGGTGPFTLAPGESMELEVAFTPESAGIKEAQLQIVSNAGVSQIDVWLTNTRTHVIVQEASAIETTPNVTTVNIEAVNVEVGAHLSINVSRPSLADRPATIEILEMTVAQAGNFSLNVSHAANPVRSEHATFTDPDRRPLQYVHLEYSIPNSMFEDTSFVLRVPKPAIPTGVEPESLALLRLEDGDWDAQAVTLINETASAYVYRVETDGFSQFVVVINDSAATQPAETPASTEEGGFSLPRIPGDPGPAEAAAGGFTLSLGWVLKPFLRDMIATFFIHFERSFRVGDEIEWGDRQVPLFELAGLFKGRNVEYTQGEVVEIGFRTTWVRSHDDIEVAVPNALLSDTVVENATSEGPLRLSIDVPIDLRADLEPAKATIRTVAAAHEAVLDEPSPAVYFMAFEETRTRLRLDAWIAHDDIGDRIVITDQLSSAVNEALVEAGISLEYPTRTLSGQTELLTQ